MSPFEFEDISTVIEVIQTSHEMNLTNTFRASKLTEDLTVDSINHK